MIEIAILFGAVSAIYRKRGWISPLVGSFAVFWQIVTSAVVTLAVYGASEMSTGGMLGISLYSDISVIAILGICSLYMPKIDPQELPKVSRVPYRILGYLVILLGMLLFFGLIASMSASGGSGTAPGGIFVVIIIGAMACFRLARQQRQAKNRWKLLQGSQPPILYLRSFAFDKGIASSGNVPLTIGRAGAIGSKFDETLARAVEKLGVYIGLGAPDDYLPTPGACKVYPTDENWQAYVDRLANVSRAVFLVEGGTMGLKWELTHLRQTLSPERVFILTAPKAYRKFYLKKQKEALWEAFRRILIGTGYGDPGKDPGPGSVLTFDANWTPCLLASGISKHAEYRQVFDRFLPPPVGPFDFKSISDILFSGVVEKEDSKARLGWGRGVAIAATIIIGTFAVSMVARAAFGPDNGGGDYTYNYDNSSTDSGTSTYNESTTDESGGVGTDTSGSSSITPPWSNPDTTNTTLDPNNAYSAWDLYNQQKTTYTGTPVSYTLELPVSWTQVPAQQNFSLLFTLNNETVFGAIVESTDTIFEQLTNEICAQRLLDHMTSVSENPINVLVRESREIDGYSWEYLRVEWRTQGIAFTSTVAVCVRPEAVYQLNGWTADAATNNGAIEAAITGFRFPVSLN